GEKNTDRKHKYGDSDCDGIVSEKDMEYMMKKVLDPKSKMPIEYKINNYMVYFDIDGDGKLTANDVAFISGIKYNYIKNNDI
ncbi:MAG: hypothetical protein IJ583_01415, partial [Firmicutes bacterium]|nr:hypothetical protein [Bacillota bacterium]